MMVDSSQVSVLSEMGIPVWQLRQSELVNEDNSDDADVEAVDIRSLLARVNASSYLICHDGTENQPTQRLLKAIFLACGLDKGICLLSVNELKAIESEVLIDSEQKCLLIFGESIVKRIFDSESTVESLRHEPQHALQSKLTTFVSASLESLLERPENKKQVWQDIRQIKQFNG